MSEAHERIWAKNGYDSWGQYGHWYADSKGGGVEYVLADRIKELEAKLAKEIEISNQRGNHIEFFLTPQMSDLQFQLKDVKAELAKVVEASVEAVWAEYTDSVESKWTFRKEHIENAILRTIAELKLAKEIEISNQRGNHIEFVLLPQMSDLHFQLKDVKAQLAKAMAEMEKVDEYLTKLQTPNSEPLNSVNACENNIDRAKYTAEVRNEAREYWASLGNTIAELKGENT